MPQNEYEDVILVQNNVLSHYRRERDGLVQGGTLSVTGVQSDPSIICNHQDNGHLELVVVVQEGGGKTKLAHFWKSAGDATWKNGPVYPAEGDKEVALIGNPIILQRAEERKDGSGMIAFSVIVRTNDGLAYFVRHDNSSKLELVAKLPIRDISGNPTAFFDKDDDIFILVPIANRINYLWVNRDGKFIEPKPIGNRVFGQVSAVYLAHLGRIEVVYSESDHLANYVKRNGQENWLGMPVRENILHARPVVARLFDELVVVARSGQQLRSYHAPLAEGDGNKQWQAREPFGTAVTGDPVLFTKYNQDNGRHYLVAAVEVAGNSLQYYWYDGSQWTSIEP